MRTISDLKAVLVSHAAYLLGEVGGVRANLGGADLRGANLGGANLGGANLYGANLYGAKLGGANLGARAILPETGAFRGFKKLVAAPGALQELIAEVEIPADARRVSSLIGRKCRASALKVVAITLPPGNGTRTSGRSLHDSSFIYEVGATVTPREEFDDDIRVECTSGLHFFLTRAEAVEYCG